MASKEARAIVIPVLREAAWAPAIVMAVYLLTACVFHLFDAYPDLDIPMHLVGGLGAAHFFLRSLLVLSRHALLGTPNRLVLRVLAFSLTCVVAIAWETAEYASDQLLGTHEQLGLDDTMGDMLIGALGALLLVWRLPETRASPPP